MITFVRRALLRPRLKAVGTEEVCLLQNCRKKKMCAPCCQHLAISGNRMRICRGLNDDGRLWACFVKYSLVEKNMYKKNQFSGNAARNIGKNQRCDKEGIFRGNQGGFVVQNIL